LSCIESSIKGQPDITGDTAVRLANLFKTTAEFWMNLQKTYELGLTERALPSNVKKPIKQRRDAFVSA
jgi:addiction module HigA family antidote